MDESAGLVPAEAHCVSFEALLLHTNLSVLLQSHRTGRRHFQSNQDHTANHYSDCTSVAVVATRTQRAMLKGCTPSSGMSVSWATRGVHIAKALSPHSPERGPDCEGPRALETTACSISSQRSHSHGMRSAYQSGNCSTRHTGPSCRAPACCTAPSWSRTWPRSGRRHGRLCQSAAA